MRIAIIVQVLEKLVSRQIFASLDNLRQPAVGQVDGVVHAALALKRKGDVRAVHLHMFGAHGGQPV